MKPITLTKYLRLALVAGAPILIGSPALLAADTAFPQPNKTITSATATTQMPARQGRPQLLADDALPPPPSERGKRGRPTTQPPDKMSAPGQRPSMKRQAANASNACSAPPNKHSRSERRPKGMTEEMAALERFLDMTPEQLAMARNLIVRIEQMSDEEKAELRERIQRVRNMDEARRKKLMELHRQMPWEERMIIYQYVRSLDRTERKQLFAQTRDFTIEQHIAFKKELLAKAKAAGFDESTLPPPDQRKGFPHHPKPDKALPPRPTDAQGQPDGPPPENAAVPAEAPVR